MKKAKQGMPYEPAPSVDPIFGEVQDCYDIINKYGTYNVQSTADAENTFPLIAPGLPKAYRSMKFTKDRLAPSAPASSTEKSDALLRRPPAQ